VNCYLSSDMGNENNSEDFYKPINNRISELVEKYKEDKDLLKERIQTYFDPTPCAHGLGFEINTQIHYKDSKINLRSSVGANHTSKLTNSDGEDISPSNLTEDKREEVQNRALERLNDFDKSLSQRLQ